MENMKIRHTEKYHGFEIEENACKWFNVKAINCWSSPTIASAKAAIDRYAAKNDLCEHGVPRKTQQPVCGCVGVN